MGDDEEAGGSQDETRDRPAFRGGPHAPGQIGGLRLACSPPGRDPGQSCGPVEARAALISSPRDHTTIARRSPGVSSRSITEIGESPAAIDGLAIVLASPAISLGVSHGWRKLPATASDSASASGFNAPREKRGQQKWNVPNRVGPKKGDDQKGGRTPFSVIRHQKRGPSPFL